MLNQTYQIQNNQNLSKPIYQSNQTNQNQINQNHQTQSTKSKTYRHPDFPELEVEETRAWKYYYISYKSLPQELQEVWRAIDMLEDVYFELKKNPNVSESLIDAVNTEIRELENRLEEALEEIYKFKNCSYIVLPF